MRMRETFLRRGHQEGRRRRSRDASFSLCGLSTGVSRRDEGAVGDALMAQRLSARDLQGARFGFVCGCLN